MSERFSNGDTEKLAHAEVASSLRVLKIFFDALPPHERNTVVQIRMQTGEGSLWRDSTAYEPKYGINENEVTTVTLEIADDTGKLQKYTSADGSLFTKEGAPETYEIRFPFVY